MPCRRVLAALAVVLLGAACSSGDERAVPASSSCPPSSSSGGWPGPVPADLPQPSGLVAQPATTAGGVTSVRFTAAGGLKDVLRPLLDTLPAAGYKVTGGDQENGEADVEFAGRSVRGRLKLTASQACLTTGLLQLRPAS